MPKKIKQDTIEKLIPILVLASVLLAFGVGVLWQKVSNLEGGSSKVVNTKTTTTGDTPGDTAAQPQPNRPTRGKLSEEQAAKVPNVTSEDHIRGDLDAQVYIVEYSDFECPFCARFHPTMQQVMDEYGDQVAWVYRHFPLDQIHPKARPAAEASECVAELGGEDAFWSFADDIFGDQTQLSDLASVASEAGVDSGAFESCVDSGKYADLVEEQYQSGIQAGVTGTPGNFVINANGDAWLIPGALPFDQVKTTIDEALSG